MLRIGELAEKLTITPKTVRYYERIGLLAPPVRTDAGYRMYADAAVSRAQLVLGLRRIGLSIQEIQDLLQDDSGLSLRQRLLALLDEKLHEIDVTLGILQGRQDDLASRHRALLATPRDQPGECVCGALLIPCYCAKGPSGGQERGAAAPIPSCARLALVRLIDRGLPCH